MSQTLALILSLFCVLQHVNGHGYLWEPPNRSSLWRLGYPNVPKNYQDNQNFCGGFSVQWEANGGECGVCGDNSQQPPPRDNEDGGIYGLGIVTRKYYESSAIQTIVRITASHLGRFTFSLCNLDESPETEECFKQLKLVDGRDSYEVTKDINQAPREHDVYIQLPEGLTCERCVLRWHYKAGNSWGLCDDGITQALGCGSQETFRSCSDISIIPRE